MSRFAPRVVPKFNDNRSDFPSWFHDRKRLDAVQNVEAGDLWKKLIGLWLQQERRLAFGLNEKIVSRILFLLCCSHPLFVGNGFAFEGEAQDHRILLQVASRALQREISRIAELQ
jgi:hypothetical protein